MSAIIVKEPGSRAEIVESDLELESLYEFIPGNLEGVYLIPNVVIFCDEEGKLKNMLPNLFIHDQAGKLVDTLNGPLVFVGRKDEDICGLTDEQIGLVYDFIKKSACDIEAYVEYLINS